MSDKARIIDLQKQVSIARAALTRISCGIRPDLAQDLASEAIYEMMPLDRKQPLQGLLGHEGRRPHERMSHPMSPDMREEGKRR